MGGGESRALAAETGKNVTNQLESITGNYEKGSSLNNYNGNFTFTFKNGTVLNPGDYIEFSTENMQFPNSILVSNNSNEKIGHLKVEASENAIDIFKKYNLNTIDYSALENLQPFQGRNPKVRVYFNEISQPLKLNSFNLSWVNWYVASSQSSTPKNFEVSITANNNKMFSQNFLHDEFNSVYARNRGMWSNGINIVFDSNKKRTEDNGLYTVLDTLKKGDRLKFTLDEDSKVYFKNTLKVDDIVVGNMQEMTFLNTDLVKLNKNDVYIPRDKTISNPEFKVVKRTPYYTEIEYIGDDMKIPQATMVNLQSMVKKEYIPQFNKAENREYYPMHYQFVRNGDALLTRTINESVFIRGMGSSFSGINVDPTYQLTVRYLDENGQQLSNSDKIINENGNDYNISPKDIPKYTFKSANKSLKGNLTEDTTIDLIYSKKQSDLTIKHIDIDTGEEIKDKIIEKKNIDDKYTITPAQINKYDYIESSESLTGTLTAPKEVILKYRKQSKSINVKIVDENGKELKSPTTITKKIGEDYMIEKPNIPNYVFKEVKDNKPLTGKITDNDEVVLVYKLNKHNVTVKYIHRGENGEVEIKSPFTKEYTVGDPLNIETPKIDGYKYKESSEPINGKVGDEDKVVKLYYSKYIPGPQGDKGLQGDKGTPGDKGDKGGKGIEGAPGREGHTPDIRIDPKSGNWIVDGEDTGFRAIVFDGKDGKDGKDGNIDYNKVKIHYITSIGEIAKPTETVDKNKVKDKLKEEDTIVAKEKDNSIIAVVSENNKESDSNRKEKEPLIKYNIISDKGEELTSSVYLQKGKELPNITIPGYKLLKIEKLSDTETRVIYSKDNSTSTKVELNNDITYRLVDENNKPISTVKYQDDKFQPELEGYIFKEKKVISEKEIVLIYQKDNVSNNFNENKIKDNTITPKENGGNRDNSNEIKQSNGNKNNSSSTNSAPRNGKIKSIIKTDAGEVLETLFLDKDVQPEIKGYKYKETKVVDKNTQELIYTSESPNLRKADVKSGIDGVTSTTVGLFASIIAAISAIVYRKRKE